MTPYELFATIAESSDPSSLERARDVGELLLLVTGIVTIVTLPLRAWLARPAIEIRERQWSGRTPTPWTFAVVDVRNAPPPRWLSLLIQRHTAFGCRVHLEFRRSGELALPPVPARWSERAEPIRPVAFQSGNVQGLVYAPAPDLVPSSMVYDLPASPRWFEIATAVLRDDGTAHAWGAESYMHAEWRHPDWGLEHGEYEVTVRVSWGDQERSRTFRLRFLASDFAEFKLDMIE